MEHGTLLEQLGQFYGGDARLAESAFKLLERIRKQNDSLRALLQGVSDVELIAAEQPTIVYKGLRIEYSESNSLSSIGGFLLVAEDHGRLVLGDNITDDERREGLTYFLQKVDEMTVEGKTIGSILWLPERLQEEQERKKEAAAQALLEAEEAEEDEGERELDRDLEADLDTGELVVTFSYPGGDTPYIVRFKSPTDFVVLNPALEPLDDPELRVDLLEQVEAALYYDLETAAKVLRRAGLPFCFAYDIDILLSDLEDDLDDLFYLVSDYDELTADQLVVAALQDAINDIQVKPVTEADESDSALDEESEG